MKRLGLLFLILILGFGLRFYQLGTNPPGLDWDEASLGWNAYSLLKTGTDEYGKKLPIAIESFHDFKPAGYVYAAIPAVALFGLNEWSTRLPSAASGVLLILAAYFFTRELIDKRDWLPELTAFLVAVSSWSLQFSRAAFEANLALFFFVSGAFFLVAFLKRRQGWWLFPAVLFLTLSMYTYHSSRLLIPLFVLGLAIYSHRLVFHHWRMVVAAGCFSLVLLSPLVVSTLRGGGTQARFASVSIFSATGLNDVAKTSQDRQNHYSDDDRAAGDLLGRVTHTKLITIGTIFLKGYLDHFNFNFLFLSGDVNGRHHAPDMGMLYLWAAPFVVSGLYFMVARKPQWWFFVFWWLAVSPVAAALSTETPHAIRSLVLLMPLQILTAYGLLGLLETVHRLCVKRVLMAVLCLAFFANIFYYLDQYFVQLPIEQAVFWQFGYKQLVAKIRPEEAKYAAVFVTKSYDQPYIYFLFYGGDPNLKNPGNLSEGFGKYHFVDFGSLPDREKFKIPREDLLVLSGSDSFADVKTTDEIKFPDGTTALRLAQRM